MRAERVAVHSTAPHLRLLMALVHQSVCEEPGTEPSPASSPSSGQNQAFKSNLRSYLRKQNQTKQPTSLHSWSLITDVAR